MPAGTCTDGATQAPAPSHLIMGALPAEATLAHVPVSKYADHLPAFQVWVPGLGEADDVRLVDADVPSDKLTLPCLGAGEGIAELKMICGYFTAVFGPLLNVFAAQKAVLMVQFAAADRLDEPLFSVVGEFRSQAPGTKAMTAALLDQVLLLILRRVLPLAESMANDVRVLSDAPVARALADMLDRPGTAHSLESLAATAGVSRSAFVQRFGRVMGRSPMAALREIRMQRAAELLTGGTHSLAQVASELGYASQSSFFRAFRTVHGAESAIGSGSTSQEGGMQETAD